MSDDGMMAEADTFTDADRELIADANHRELKRTETYIGNGVVCGHEKREIFSFEHPNIGTIRFDVRGIKDAILANKLPAEMYRVEVPEDFYQHVLNNNGVEPARVEKVTTRDMERPGIIIQWPDGHSTLIDGNHRMCRRYQLGLTSFRFLVVHVFNAVPYMCRPGEEAELFALDDNDRTILHTEISIEE